MRTSRRETFDGGAVEISGLELVASNELQIGGLSLPTTLTYTFTDTEFQSSFNASLYELWGEVTAGDELPYVPEHQIGLNIETTIDAWDFTTRLKYKSEQRTAAGQGSIPSNEKIGSIFVTDLAASRMISEQTSLTIYINNLFDEEYEVSRHPDGLRPGAPRSFAVGLSSTF